MIRLLLTIFLFIATPIMSHAGGYVGNGGDVLNCEADPANSLKGLYSLDYILTMRSASGDNDLVHVEDWRQSMKRIGHVLKEKAPMFLPYFAEFVETSFNIDDFRKPRVWEPAPFGLVDIKDEEIVSQVPRNCKSGGDRLQVVQAVIRQDPEYSGTKKGKIVYKFVPDVVEKLNKGRALQLSFLLVHEWLWDISGNVDRNRRVNRFLHSKDIERMSPRDVQETLRGMGLAMPGEESDVFDPGSCQGIPLTLEHLKKRFGEDKRVFYIAGEMKAVGRSRMLDCPRDFPDCGRIWKQPSFVERQFLSKGRWFTTFAWPRTPMGVDPIQIINPDVPDAPQNGAGQLECHFVPNELQNLECTIYDYPLGVALTGIRDDDGRRYEQKVRGVITTDCVRVETRYVDDLQSDYRQEFQSVFFLKYRMNLRKHH